MSGDGAEWICHIDERHFPGAIQIVDIWHVRQHLLGVSAGKVFPADEKRRKGWAKRRIRMLNRQRLLIFPTRMRRAARGGRLLRAQPAHVGYQKFRRRGLFSALE